MPDNSILPTDRVSPEARLILLRNEWIAAENRRTAAYQAFVDANRQSPLHKELEVAKKQEQRARDAYAHALNTPEISIFEIKV